MSARRYGIVARVIVESGQHVAYVYTPNNGDLNDPVIIFPKGSQRLTANQWISFQGPIDLPPKYQIKEYERIDALLPTKACLKTIRIKLDDVIVPSDFALTREMSHNLLGGIYDALKLLRAGEKATFVVVRSRPTPAKMHCTWFVSKVLEREKLPMIAQDSEGDDSGEGGERPTGEETQKEEDGCERKKKLDVFFTVKTEKADSFVTEKVILYYGAPEACNGIILAGNVEFHMKKESVSWRYPHFGELFERNAENDGIWRVDVAPEVIQAVFNIFYDHQITAGFLTHDADFKVFWSTLVDICALLQDWEMVPLEKFLVREAISHVCLDHDCWRCVNRYALAFLEDHPCSAVFSKTALADWKTHCLPALQSPVFSCPCHLQTLIDFLEQQAK